MNRNDNEGYTSIVLLSIALIIILIIIFMVILI